MPPNQNQPSPSNENSPSTNNPPPSPAPVPTTIAVSPAPPDQAMNAAPQALEAPAPQVTNQVVGQQTSPLPPGFSQADARAQEKKRTRKRRLIIGGAVFASLIILAIVGLIAYPSLLKFKTVTYDNGKGTTFQLKFYAHYTIKPAPGGDGFQEIASKTGTNGLYPLAINISKTAKKPAAAILNCTGAGVTDALQVLNKPSGNIVHICAINEQGAPSKLALYLGILQSGSDYYALVIDQDVNLQQLTSSKQSAQAGLGKINILAYHDAITTIVSSIKPVH